MSRRMRRVWWCACASLALASTAACGLSAVGQLEARNDGGSVNGTEGGGPVPDDASDAGGGGDAAFDAPIDAPDPVVRDDAGCPAGRGPPMLRLFDGDSAPLCIDQTEVSSRQYEPFVAEFAAGRTPTQIAACAGNASVVPTDMTSGTMPSLDADDPVDRIDWCDADLFCRWAGKHLCARRDGTSTYIASADAEDENIGEWYAACSQDGASSSVPALANLAANGGIQNRNADDEVNVTADPAGGPTYSVGLLHHIVGNVEEWADGCDGAGTCVARGASVKSTGTTDCTTRTTHPRMDRKADLGFRCCATPM